jgi:hypothetical protein
MDTGATIMRELSTQQLKEQKAHGIKMIAAYQTKLAEVQHRLEWLDNYLLPVWVDGVEMSQQDAAELLSPGVYRKQDRQRLVAIAMRPHEDTCVTLGTHHVVSNRRPARTWLTHLVGEFITTHQLTAKALMGMTVTRQQKVRLINRYTIPKSQQVNPVAAANIISVYTSESFDAVLLMVTKVTDGSCLSHRWKSHKSGYDIEVRRL